MFSKKPKEDSGGGGKRKGANLMNQMGFGMPTNMEDMEAMVYGDGDDDDDLEAELAALTGEGTGAKKASPQKKGPVHLSVIEQMAARNIKAVDDDSDDVSDTEDPDLMAELAQLEKDGPAFPRAAAAAPTPSPKPTPSLASQRSPASLSPATPPQPVKPPPASAIPSQASSSLGGDAVTVVQGRIENYQQALQNAREAGDTSKQRRLDRGLKTLTDTLKKVKTGKPITEDDIPPPVAMGASTPAITPAVTAPISGIASTSTAGSDFFQPRPGPSQEHRGSSSADEGMRGILLTRKEQYRHAAVAAKRSGDMPTAAKYAKIAKQFDTVLTALEEGKQVDLHDMPPALPVQSTSSPVASQTTRLPSPGVAVQRQVVQGTGETKQPQESSVDESPPEPTEEEAKRLFHAPDPPKTVLEALMQRLEKYKSTESQAKEAGDSSKARRMGRIVKQYEDAIKLYKTGKPVDFEELPTPPGYGPIPVNAAGGPPAAPTPTPRPQPSTSQPAGAVAGSAARLVAHPLPAPRQPAPRQPAPAPPVGASASAAAGISRAASSRKSGFSRQEQQLNFLRERMEEFKVAAMQAKKNNDLELAKHHVRMMKGLEPMVEALESGLPVDLSKVPPSPLANEENEDKFVVVTAEQCQPTGDRDEQFSQLEQDLIIQMRTCATNSQHFTKLGDVPSAAKFQKLEQGCRKDLESLKSAQRHGDPVPKFHYETRSFSVVQCNTELADNDMELSVIRGISLNLPSGYSEKDMDTFVKYEFQFPTEEGQTGHTQTAKGTINPEYNETFKLQIDRKSRSFARVLERKGIKLDVYHKRGFFKGDKLLGSATVKLTPLESKCTLHDSFDLTEGRKSVGGKLEVKVRVRDPFKGRQVEETKEKWLVIDQFIRTLGSQSQPGLAASQKPKMKSIGAELLSKLSSKKDSEKPDSLEGTTCMEVLRYEKQQLDKQISYLKDSLSAIQTQTLKHKSTLLEEKLELQQKQLREGGVEAWKAYIAVVEKEASAFELEARQLTKVGDVQKAETMMTKLKLARKELAAIKAKIPA